MLVSPSTLIALNERSAARRVMARSSSTGTVASVMTNASSVAMFGWIMPAPLAMPRTTTSIPPTPTATPMVFDRVSVVMIASATSPYPTSVGVMARTAVAMRWSGRGTPMTPVLATATSWRAQPIFSAAAPAIATASRSPCSPVQAFAFPLLTTIARSAPRSRCRRVTTQGAAMTWFVVNTPAALQGRSATMSPTSRRSGTPVFTPALAAPARKPLGSPTAVTARSAAPRAPSFRGGRSVR